MDLEDHYERLWLRSIKKFEAGDLKTGAKIDDPADERYGLTLLFRPSLQIRHCPGTGAGGQRLVSEKAGCEADP